MSLNSILQIIAADRRVISYRPELTKIIGSVNSTILFQQIMFRWISNNQKEFYKYKEPCQARHYRVGDSWTEELGFTRREFDGALKILVDLGAVNYRVDIERKTWYSLNEEKAISIINQSYPEKAETVSRKGGNVLYEEAETNFTNGHIPPFDLNTEITTKITTKINNTEAAPLEEIQPDKIDLLNNQPLQDSTQTLDNPTLSNGFKEKKEKSFAKKEKTTAPTPTPEELAQQALLWAFIQADPYWRSNASCKTPSGAFKHAVNTRQRERGLWAQFCEYQQNQSAAKAKVPRHAPLSQTMTTPEMLSIFDNDFSSI